MSRTRAILALLLAAAIWGATFPLIKAALQDVTPLAFNALRFGLAALCLIPALRRVPGPAFRAGLLLGVFLSVGFAVQTAGLQTTTPSRSAFLTALYAPFTPLVAVVLGGRRPNRWSIAAVVVALGGTVLLTGSYPEVGGALSTGDWLTVACAFCFAVQIVLIDRFGARYQLGDLLVAQIFGAALVGLVLVPILEHPAVHWSPLLVVALAVEVGLATLLCLRLQLAGQKVVSPTEAAIIFAIEPVVAALASRWALGERLTAVQWTGGSLILLALVIPGLGKDKGGTAVTND
ncbi:MAG: DMT family transporter [Gemmatimonadota bacterium]